MAKVFKIWANVSVERAIDWDGKKDPVRIVLAPFCVMRYVNNGRYSPGYRTAESKTTDNPRKKNVEILETRSPDSPSDFTNFRIIRIRALRDIAEKEEILLVIVAATTAMLRKFKLIFTLCLLSGVKGSKTHVTSLFRYFSVYCRLRL